MGTLYPDGYPSQRFQPFDEFLPRHGWMIQAKTCIVNRLDVFIDFAPHLRVHAFPLADASASLSPSRNLPPSFRERFRMNFP